MFKSKLEVIDYLRENNIIIEELTPNSEVLGWEVKVGLFAMYLEAPVYTGLVESSIYQHEIV
jgi:L-amino acid N-acyltransferase YncA